MGRLDHPSLAESLFMGLLRSLVCLLLRVGGAVPQASADAPYEGHHGPYAAPTSVPIALRPPRRISPKAVVRSCARRPAVCNFRREGESLTYLEYMAVGKHRRSDYEDTCLDFLYFAQGRGLPFEGPSQVDGAMSLYFEEMFSCGDHASLGRATLAAFEHFFPSYGRHETFPLPRARRCLVS